MANIDRTGNKIFTSLVMKTKQWLITSALVLSALASSAGRAEETTTIRANRVNVRGKPTMFSEVITQLKESEAVTILEEIKLAKPKLGEPTNWVKIKMPVNTPVWVNAAYVDPANKTVSSPKLNVRAGPGENFSVVGVLGRGDSVKEIRVVDDWMEIETPESAYGFVAAEYLNKEGGAPALIVEAPAAPGPAPAAPQIEPPTVTTLAPPPPIPAQNVPIESVKEPEEPAVGQAIEAPPLPAPSAIQQTTTPPPTETQPLPLPAIAPPVPRPADTLIRRVVTREGIVRGSGSIQAPTSYELASVENRKTLNFLLSPTTNIVVKTYRGQRVLVTGEEFIDSRWPLTPVLQIETLNPVTP